MKHKLFTFTFYLSVACCLYVVASCSMLKKVGLVGGGAAGGAVAGAVVGGPVGAGVGGAAGALTASALGENDELRDGSLTGEDAKNKEIERLRRALQNRPVVEIETPFITHWVWNTFWCSLAWIVWLKGHHVIYAIRFRSLSSLLNIFIPSWLQDRLGTSLDIPVKRQPEV